MRKTVRVLSLQSSLFMVLWQSPDIPFLSCVLVSARLRVCSDPGTLDLFQAQVWFRVEVRTLTLQVWSCCGSVRSRVRSGRALLCPCAFVVSVLLSLLLSCFVWLSCLSWFVWTRGLWVSLLAACRAVTITTFCCAIYCTKINCDKRYYCHFKTILFHWLYNYSMTI